MNEDNDLTANFWPSKVHYIPPRRLLEILIFLKKYPFVFRMSIAANDDYFHKQN